MKRKLVVTTLSLIAVLSWAGAPPASAQAKGCKAFGQNISILAQMLGSTFGQTAAEGAPLNDTVVSEKRALCQ